MPALQLQQNQTPQMQTLSCHRCFWTLVCWYRLCFHLARTVFSATGDQQSWVNIPRNWKIWNIAVFCGIVITHILFTWKQFLFMEFVHVDFFLGVGVTGKNVVFVSWILQNMYYLQHILFSHLNLLTPEWVFSFSL